MEIFFEKIDLRKVITDSSCSAEEYERNAIWFKNIGTFGKEY